MTRNFYHTIGDTDPLEVRLVRNGEAQDLTGTTVTLYIYPLHADEGTAALVAAVMTPNPDQTNNRGYASYVFTAPDDAALGTGLFAFRVRTLKNNLTSTYPNGEHDESYGTLRVNPGV